MSPFGILAGLLYTNLDLCIACKSCFILYKTNDIEDFYSIYTIPIILRFVLIMGKLLWHPFCRLHLVPFWLFHWSIHLNNVCNAVFLPILNYANSDLGMLCKSCLILYKTNDIVFILF